MRRTNKQHGEMSHVSMAALAVGSVVLAGVVLVYVSRHVHENPGEKLLVLLALPVLIALALVVARRRRAHA